jgi:hypothetical protein
VQVKEAVAKAKTWLNDVLREEGVQNIGLEEVEFDESENAWLITLGFSRPWNSVRNAYTAISGEPAAKRSYRVIAVKDQTRDVTYMKRRETAD